MATVITPTGDRPEALALLNRYMCDQTDQGFCWVVVDDGQTPSDRPARCDVYVQLPYEDRNTQCRNLLAGLEHYEDGPLLICEDDDWYAPHYVATQCHRLHGRTLVGEGQSHYYHVGTGAGVIHSNDTNASLASSAMWCGAVRFLRQCLIEGHKYLDRVLWQRVQGAVYPWDGLCVGIKGMPGRKGIGSGHRLKGEPMDLREWIGSDANGYAPFRV